MLLRAWVCCVAVKRLCRVVTHRTEQRPTGPQNARRVSRTPFARCRCRALRIAGKHRTRQRRPRRIARGHPRARNSSQGRTAAELSMSGSALPGEPMPAGPCGPGAPVGPCGPVLPCVPPGPCGPVGPGIRALARLRPLRAASRYRSQVPYSRHLSVGDNLDDGTPPSGQPCRCSSRRPRIVGQRAAPYSRF